MSKCYIALLLHKFIAQITHSLVHSFAQYRFLSYLQYEQQLWLAKTENKIVCFSSLDFHSQIIKQHIISPTTLLNGK